MALNAIFFKDESSTHTFSNRVISLINLYLLYPSAPWIDSSASKHFFRMFHLFAFRRCNLVYFPICSIGMDYCLYRLFQEDLVFLLALLLTLSKFVDVGLDPVMYGRILNIFCIRFLDSSVKWSYLGHFFKSQSKISLSFPYTLFFIS